MSIYMKTTKAKNLYNKTTAIKNVYMKTTKVWSNKTDFIDLGNAKTFDVKSVYSDWSSLTLDNFYALTYTNVSGSDSINATGYRQYLRLYAGITKSYSNGVLTWQTGASGTYGNVHVYLIADTSKLQYVGNGKTFNVASLFSDYANLTVNDFVALSGDDTGYGQIASGNSTSGKYSASNSLTFTKTYNASTGALTFKEVSKYSGDLVGSGSSEKGFKVYRL